MVRALACSLVGLTLVAFTGLAQEAQKEQTFRGHVVKKECPKEGEKLYGHLTVAHKEKDGKEVSHVFGIGHKTKWLDAAGEAVKHGCAAKVFDPEARVQVTYIEVTGKDGKQYRRALVVQLRLKKGD